VAITYYYYNIKTGKLFESKNRIADKLYSTKEVIQLTKYEYNYRIKQQEALEAALKRFQKDLSNKSYIGQTDCLPNDIFDDIKDIWKKV
jgi:hypothetical protein